ncbi:OmpA/MotB family protein [Tuberibacillus sp. Marseille-P3662]|uniref:OmpA/MotB family protein n=1 Tax=Tuberibacillus sp. Marseille-P3662 TaxID=1965358 RepID=UPI000A1CE3C0|nr:OmpA family protein [Tuberibacillus sp. Marseille-P3662]
MPRRRHQQQSPQEHYWPSFTDMMAMVVLVFLFIAIIAFVQAIYEAYDQREVERELAQVTDVKKNISDIINQKLAEKIGKDKITRGPNNTISVEGNVLFESAKAKVSDHGKTVLNGVADALVNIIENEKLSQYIYIILIEGHTDSVPYDNWSLSTDRAVNVLKYMQSANTKLTKNAYAKYLAATGYSKYKPIADDHTAASRQKNRRISFQIILDDNKWQNKIQTLLDQ